MAQGGNFIDHGFTHVGAMSVLETILRYEYLWIRIRVQGGAYGAFANFYDDGNMIFCSYRDPNLVETLNVYKELPEYLRQFTLTDREMRKYIIGCLLYTSAMGFREYDKDVDFKGVILNRLGSDNHERMVRELSLIHI